MWILKRNLALVILSLALISASNANGQPLEYEEVQDDAIKFFVYTRQNDATPQAINADVESIVRSVFNPTKPTTLAIHNTMGNKDAEEYTLIKDTKLKLEDGNIIIVDYSSIINDDNFEAAFSSAPLVAKAITDLVVVLHEIFDVNLKELHIVGFGLGGQISGLVGKSIYQSCGTKVKRITAFDPAGILFMETTPDNERLTPNDAAYVEVIHTNTDDLGFLTPCGHADYYPNGGKIQPGCSVTDINCSHKRAYEFIPEMWLPVENQELLLLKCGNIEFMSIDNCRWLNAKMGDLEQYLEGIYFVETNANKPFGKGAFKTDFF